MNMLPVKQASVIKMGENTTRRMSLQEMVKAAQSGVVETARLASEANRQFGGTTKQAAAVTPKASSGYSGEYVEKLAQAVEYLLEHEKHASDAVTEPGASAQQGVGEGPNALEVSQARSGTNAIEAGQTGSATPAHQSPKTPASGSHSGNSHDPGTGLETNETTVLPSYPTKLSSAEAPIELIRKLAGIKKSDPTDDKTAGIKDLAKSVGEGLKGGAKAMAEHPGSHTAAGAAAVGIDRAIRGKSKEASLVDFVLEQKKQAADKVAEDAINPAKISAGAAVPPDTSEAGEQGGAPAGGQPDGPRGLVGSNQAAIDATKGEAKTQQVKSDMKPILAEPAMSSQHDSVLQKALDHTGQAGVKISSADQATKTAAARALLEKLAAEAMAKKKTSNMGPGTYQAPSVGGVAQGGM
jgi:hypothetical protein